MNLHCNILLEDIKKSLIYGLISIKGTESYYSTVIKKVSFEVYIDKDYIHYFSDYRNGVWNYYLIDKNSNLKKDIPDLIKQEDLSTPTYNKVGNVLLNILKKNR